MSAVLARVGEPTRYCRTRSEALPIDVKPSATHSWIVFILTATAVLLLGCGSRLPQSGDRGAEEQPAIPGGKIKPPLSAALVLENRPQPGGVAELTLKIESGLPESCAVEVNLSLPRNLGLTAGSPALRRTVKPNAPISIPFKVRVPDGRRYLVHASVAVPNPQGKTFVTGSSVVIDLGEPEKPQQEPVTLQTSDGRTLGVTVVE